MSDINGLNETDDCELGYESAKPIVLELDNSFTEDKDTTRSDVDRTLEGTESGNADSARSHVHERPISEGRAVGKTVGQTTTLKRRNKSARHKNR